MNYLLKALNMDKFTYYFEIGKVDAVAERNNELLFVIKEIFEEHKHKYGVRRIYQELLNRGYKVNHKRVQRLMHQAGLCEKRSKEKYHSYKGKVGKIADSIIKEILEHPLPYKSGRLIYLSLISMGEVLFITRGRYEYE